MTCRHNRQGGRKAVCRVKATAENENTQTEWELVRGLAEKGREKYGSTQRTIEQSKAILKVEGL